VHFLLMKPYQCDNQVNEIANKQEEFFVDITIFFRRATFSSTWIESW